MLLARFVTPERLSTPGPASGFGGLGVVMFVGVFSVAFLIAIILATIGVIRARHNPERYGPQQARPGRPKQSRAKGLTRAIIESIPIVRFGENNDKDADGAANRDIELADTVPANSTQSTTVNAINPSTPTDESTITSSTSTDMPATAQDSPSTAELTIPTRPGSLECSICLEDFVKGEETRVLPCNHRFHPVCIDPWLLNVSGTCPICRYDLRPATTNNSNTEATSTDEPPPPPPPHEVSDNTPGRSRFRELRRAHASPEEYITALRQLYHELENRHPSHASTHTEAAAHRESRPTSTLRGTFHIRTGLPESQQTLPNDPIRALERARRASSSGA